MEFGASVRLSGQSLGNTLRKCCIDEPIAFSACNWGLLQGKSVKSFDWASKISVLLSSDSSGFWLLFVIEYFRSTNSPLRGLGVWRVPSPVSAGSCFNITFAFCSSLVVGLSCKSEAQEICLDEEAVWWILSALFQDDISGNLLVLEDKVESGATVGLSGQSPGNTCGIGELLDSSACNWGLLQGELVKSSGRASRFSASSLSGFLLLFVVEFFSLRDVPLRWRRLWLVSLEVLTSPCLVATFFICFSRIVDPSCKAEAAETGLDEDVSR